MSSMKQKAVKHARSRTTAESAKKPTTTKPKKPLKSASSVANLSNGFDSDHENDESNAGVVEVKEQNLSVTTASKGHDRKRTNRKRKAEKSVPNRPEFEEAEEVVPKVRKAVAATKDAVKQPKATLFEVPKLPTLSGVLFVIGINDVGQLGLGESIQGKARPAELNFPIRFVDIAAGGMHSVCLTDKGEVYTFGCNDEGALGRPTEDEGSEFIPKKVEVPGIAVKVSAGDSHSAALTEGGQVYIWGNFRSGDGSMGLTAQGVKQNAPFQILKNTVIVNISSGSEHLVCLSNQGVVYTCGCGESGQLGRITERSSKGAGRKGLTPLLVPDTVQLVYRNLPVEQIWTGSYSTFVKVKGSGEIFAFGLNNYNQLGFEGQLAQFRPKKVVSFSPSCQWQRISGGQHHTLALDGKGQVYSLGRKEYGRLGLGENCDEKSVPTLIPTLAEENCIDISSGNIVSFSVTDKGTVYSWGMGTNDQLGHGNDDDCHIPKLIEGKLLNSWHVFRVSGGGQHTLILANRKAVTEEKSSDKE